MAGQMSGFGGPSKAQQDQWKEKAMQLMKRHDQNADGVLDPRELASAINELCGTHGFSPRSLTAALGLDAKLDNSAYRCTPVEFCDLYRRAMLLGDSGEAGGPAAGGGGSGARGVDRLMGQAVDALRDLDAKSEASLKQAYNNYCRLTTPGAGKMMMDGDLKLMSAQWHQLCADVGLAQPIGPVAPADLASIFSAASQRTNGLTLKQFLTALAMISPDLTTLCNHMVAQLGPQMKPRAGGDAPQPASFPLRNLDLKATGAAANWGTVNSMITAANAFAKAGAGMLGGGGGGGGGGMQGSITAALAMMNGGGGGGVGGGGFSIEIEETLNRAHYAEPLAPIVGGPITAKLGGGGIKRSSLALGTGALRGNGSAAGQKSLESPASQMVLLDRLAAAEARITQLEQQQAFARELMASSGAGATGWTSSRPGGGGGGGEGGMSGPQVAALEAKIAALEAELSRVAPGAEAPRQVSELRDSLELLSGRVEGLTKSLERSAKRVEAAEAAARAAEAGVRDLQGPVKETSASLACLRQITDQLKSGVLSKESELMTTLVTRISATEGQLEGLEGQLRKLAREGKLTAALPSREAMVAMVAAAGEGGNSGGGNGSGAAPPAPSTPTAAGEGSGGGAISGPTPPPGPAKPAGPKAAAAAAAGGGGGSGDYFVQSLGVVQLDTEEDIRLQIKLLTEAMDNMKRRVAQLAGSTSLNPIDFPTRNELSEVKRVIMGDMADIDSKYIKVQKEVATLSLKMPALEKKVEGSALASGSEVVNRLVGMGMARMADVKETENYLVDRAAGTTKQFENLKRDMQDIQGDLQANMEKLVTQFNQINRQLMEARREAGAPGVAAVAASAAGGGGPSGATSAATAATAASAAATAAQTASEARSAVERERTDRERETRELRERIARAETHLGGALGELQTVVGAELSSIKEVLTQLEAAMNQADGDAMRLIRELDGSLRSAMGALEKATGEQNEMTGKVIMKMARQITEMQVKLKELATLAAAPPAPPSPQMAHILMQHPPQQQQGPTRSEGSATEGTHGGGAGGNVPFAARLLAAQAAGANSGVNTELTSPMNAPNSPSLMARRGDVPYGGGGGGAAARMSASGGPGALLARVSERGGGTCDGGIGGNGGGGMPRNVGTSPARGMLAADPPPAPAPRTGTPRLSDTGGTLRQSGAR